ncbi:3'(2'),5'-bisphosphate nucleotidase [Blastopirellula sp. JC732]|uniref:3'(2'),5'-bisphosphate nucleotidase n=1 Tax=Blastopirellula sediminis TaxID=2894196 RepID=A0A9X1ML99_9BACT|nr:3'(2'),5'-bisphosphate nucleotidase [Blastopirellula sediminis]MCC9608898.1 3'(2'),5'-bisphosphate nucleotidase [Blastopirellula sediminis]MCC9628325.1 3'(2'),5'-bisphosphate nucleotidase [Blastopirellula sediminis]
MSAYQQEVEIALQAVTSAAVLCQNVRHGDDFAALAKSDKSPVTVADFGSQAIVCRAIREAFPDDLIIAEENADALRAADQAPLLGRVVAEVQKVLPGADEAQTLAWIDAGVSRDAAPRVWTLDPIDGTKGFLRGGQYAVALALLIDGQVEVAALACPALDDDGAIFWAVRGQGAFHRTADGDKAIAVTPTVNSAEAALCESVESGHSDHDQSAQIAKTLEIARPSVRMDSQAKYAAVARGDADIYLRLPTIAGYEEKIWDHAAGFLVINEAGGKVTDIDGKPLDFSLGSTLKNNRGVVATNGRLHDVVIAAIASAS